jgi:hypothetical protein
MKEWAASNLFYKKGVFYSNFVEVSNESAVNYFERTGRKTNCMYSKFKKA